LDCRHRPYDEPVPSVIDLFAGCGGMTSGFVAAGFEPSLAIESNLHAAATYAANFGEDHTLWQDISTVTPSEVPKADVVIGGPPCQGFSNLGAKNVNDPRNKLWREYLRVVRLARPKVFVIENVDRFMRTPEFELLRDEAAGGSLSGYRLSFGHLNAADFGVAQRRVRTIVIGSRIGAIPLPQPTHGRTPTLDGVEQWIGTRERISHTPEAPTSTDLPESTVELFSETVPGVFKGLELHLGRNPTAISLQRYDHIPPGGGRFDLPDHLLSRCWREKRTGTTDVMGRMRWEQPAHTIRTEFFKPEKGAYLHPQWDKAGRRRVNRPITHFEAALLQDFPEDYLWCGSKVQIARQIGNAVPLGLAKALAFHLREHLG
jgi:DNA (cytosine-5)-methyltransferase 1